MVHYILCLLFVAGMVLSGYALERPLCAYFGFSRSCNTKILGSFFGFTLFSLLLGIFAIFGNLSNLNIVVVVLVTAAIIQSLWWYTGFEQITIGEKPVCKPPKNLLWLIVFYGFLVGIGFQLLAASRSSEVIFSPWQTISPYFIFIFFAATLLLGVLVYLGLDSSWLLGLFIIHAFLMHSYLPLTHDLLYGADNWRHIATEERLVSGTGVIQPVVTDGTSKISFVIGELSYGQIWGTSVFFTKALGFNLIDVNKWLVVIVWSIFVPVILYEIGKALGWSSKWSSFLVWVSFLPFALQVGGSFSLPVNLGFVFWLSLLLLIFKRAARPNKNQLYFLITLGILSLFGYALFAVLFWLTFVVFEFLKHKHNLLGRVVSLIVVIISLPVLEVLFGSMQLHFLNIFPNLKQFIGNLSSFYLATGPRPHDIATGNIIFNQTPSYAFAPNFITASLGWTVLFMVVFWAVVFWGLKKNFYALAVLTSGLMLTYLFRYISGGEHVLLRRLDAVLAFLLMIFFVRGLQGIQFNKNWAAYLGVFVLSLAISASFTLGPDTRASSTDEYKAMKYVWEYEKGPDRHCVIANTYPLLNLEALSQKNIVGGGFPISSTFEQAQLAQILKKVNNNGVNKQLADEAFPLTGASTCWFVGDFKAGITPQKSYGNIRIWAIKK